MSGMSGVRYVYWQDGAFWIGYLEEFPDYMTQGESLEELQENLRDLLATGPGPAGSSDHGVRLQVESWLPQASIEQVQRRASGGSRRVQSNPRPGC